MTDMLLEQILARRAELHASGLDSSHAFDIAWLEERIRQWPAAWGDDLHVLVYGDFEPPTEAITYSPLRITVLPEKKTSTIIQAATVVLEAIVNVKDKSVPAITDAAKRINLLLGMWTLKGNSGCGWWSWITHPGGGGTVMKLTHADIDQATTALLQQPAEVLRKLEAALYWVREPRNLVLESYRPDILRTYSSYWNAFECLVEAVCIVNARPASTAAEKQSKINAFIEEHSGPLTAADIQDCYRNIVNPGFAAKADHALEECFGSRGPSYFEECFRRMPKEDRLYDIRNAINHGDIDAENPHELLRVSAKLSRLMRMVWPMFRRFII